MLGRVCIVCGECGKRDASTLHCLWCLVKQGARVFWQGVTDVLSGWRLTVTLLAAGTLAGVLLLKVFTK